MTNQALCAIILIERRKEVKTMNERIARIEAIERELWLMEFADRWTPADWAHRAELQRELENLRNN